MGTGCGQLSASNETADHKGISLFFHMLSGVAQTRAPPSRCRNRTAQKYILVDFQHFDPFRAARLLTMADFQHIFRNKHRGGNGLRPKPEAMRPPKSRCTPCRTRHAATDGLQTLERLRPRHELRPQGKTPALGLLDDAAARSRVGGLA